MKLKLYNFCLIIKNNTYFIISIILLFVIYFKPQEKSYKVFIEFANAYGVQKGTSIRLRGLKIGNVISVQSQYNSILTLVKIDSSSSLIPKNSLVEINQTGLLNDSVIDIFPLDLIDPSIIEDSRFDVFSSKCINSNLVCNLSYLEGDRGLNYDDLVRATTRISQRFDDPRLFNVLYLLLSNSLELSNDLLESSSEIFSILSLLYNNLQKCF